VDNILDKWVKKGGNMAGMVSFFCYQGLKIFRISDKFSPFHQFLVSYFPSMIFCIMSDNGKVKVIQRINIKARLFTLINKKVIFSTIHFFESHLLRLLLALFPARFAADS
jgi:hypothetical protein